jgi:hypothetical protein
LTGLTYKYSEKNTSREEKAEMSQKYFVLQKIKCLETLSFFVNKLFSIFFRQKQNLSLFSLYAKSRWSNSFQFQVDIFCTLFSAFKTTTSTVLVLVQKKTILMGTTVVRIGWGGRSINSFSPSHFLEF